MEDRRGSTPQRVVLTDRSRLAIAAEVEGVSVQELRRRLRAGEFQKGPEQEETIACGLDQFMRHLESRRSEGYGEMRPGTLRSYRYDIDYLRRFLEGEIPGGKMHEITHDLIRAWLNLPPQTRDRDAKELAPATRLRKLQLLRQLFDFAEEKLWVRRNPMSGFKKPRLDPMEPRFLTETEYRELLERLRSPRDRMLMRVMGECGLRIGAAVHLRVRDVILYPRDGGAGHLLLHDGKGGRSGKAIIMPALLEPLREYLVEQGLVGHPTYYLFFPGQKPWQHLDPSQVTKIFRRAMGRRAHGRPTTPHSLRHRYGHRLRVMGTDLDDIREFMGHASVRTTEIYTVRPLKERHAELLRRHPMGGMSVEEVAQEPEA